MVQLREEANAPPPVHRVPGVGSSDQDAVEEDREGLPLGAPEGAVCEVTIYLRGAGQRFQDLSSRVVEGGGHRSCVRDSGGYAS